MPLALSESLDDPVTYSASTDFRGGMNSTVLPHLLQDTQYAEAANMVLTKSGRVQTRPGTTLVTAAPSVAAPIKHLGWYDRSLSITAVVAARDNEVKLWDGSAMNATTDDPYTITGAVSAFQLHDNFLFYGAAKAFKLTAASMAEVTVAVGAGAIATRHANRVFRAGDINNPETLYASDILDGTTFDAGNNIIVGAEGESITSLHSWDVNNLLVHKTHSTYMVITTAVGVGTPASIAAGDWVVQPISSTLGCAAPETTVQVGTDVWWLSTEGVVSVRRLQQETQREITGSVSAPIQSYIDRINWVNVSKSTAVYFDNKYILSVPLDSSTEPNFLLVFDTYHQVWAAYWTGLPASGLVVSYFGGLPELFLGLTDGKLMRMTSILTEDNSVPIASSVTLKAFSFNEPVSPKSLLSMEMEFQDSLALVSVDMVSDGRANETLLTGQITGETLTPFPWTFPVTLVDPGHYRKTFSLLGRNKVRQVQPRIYSTANLVSLRSVILSGFVETTIRETP